MVLVDRSFGGKAFFVAVITILHYPSWAIHPSTHSFMHFWLSGNRKTIGIVHYIPNSTRLEPCPLKMFKTQLGQYLGRGIPTPWRTCKQVIAQDFNLAPQVVCYYSLLIIVSKQIYHQYTGTINSTKSCVSVQQDPCHLCGTVVQQRNNMCIYQRRESSCSWCPWRCTIQGEYVLRQWGSGHEYRT